MNMKNDVKVSVVMAVYNGEKYLRQALDTIINQSLKEIEIICVDDGSTDNSLEILNEYKQNDSRVKVLRHLEKTDGAAAARNMGMEVAVGEYLSFLDADDFFELDMLEKAYAKAKDNGADVVLFDAYVYDDISKRNYKESWILNHNNLPNNDCFKPEECKNTIFRITMGAAWAAIFKRRMVIDNELKFESIYHTDDLVFVYLAYCCANQISILDERLVHYRKNVYGSQSSNAVSHPEAGYMAPLVLKQKLIQKQLYDTYKNSLAVLALEVGHWHLCSMTGLDNFYILFEALKNKYLEELGTTQLTKEMARTELIEWRDSVLSDTPEEYLLKRQIIDESAHYFNNVPIEVKDNAKVVIYGAGGFGSALLSKIIAARIFKVMAWVDRKYTDIGYPVQAVETIMSIDYDYIFVAVEYMNVYTSIKKYLIGMGVDESKIILVRK